MKAKKIFCFECDSGVYDIIYQDFETCVNINGNIEKIIVPNTKQLVCNNCEDICIDSEGSDHIENFRANFIKEKNNYVG